MFCFPYISISSEQSLLLLFIFQKQEKFHESFQVQVGKGLRPVIINCHLPLVYKKVYLEEEVDG